MNEIGLVAMMTMKMTMLMVMKPNGYEKILLQRGMAVSLPDDI
jgi:hypothetical protein